MTGALVAAKDRSVRERDNCIHLAQRLDTSWAAKEALRQRLLEEDECRGNEALLPKPLLPTPCDPAFRTCCLTPTGTSAPVVALTPLPVVAPPPPPYQYFLPAADKPSSSATRVPALLQAATAAVMSPLAATVVPITILTASRHS